MTVMTKPGVYVLLVVGFIGVLFLQSDWLGKRMYPVQYPEDIKRLADKYKQDPYLIAAIIRTESNFDPGVESHKGAFGAMQLMPDTAEWIVETGNFPKDMLSSLDQAEVNVELGSWYLRWLHDQFGGNVTAVVAAYNAGPGNVKRWMQDGRWNGQPETVNDIPFGETRHYVQKVTYFYKKYKKLYPEGLQTTMLNVSSVFGFIRQYAKIL
ncbi:lytic transglycosylase domain-containing protein [Paenibacillus sp. y28]|uniref:lytic transglycosylase domain-containing protein n=1 Tax=Paenibacillus sp. y28 TaxID=3129110 RepID=UPI00301ACB5E